MNTKDTELVVAWYEEDIGWIADANLEPWTTVYAKGSGMRYPPTFERPPVPLPNVGRESHTYVYHIVQNYDNLADVTFFVQGRCSDHCPQIAVMVRNHVMGSSPALQPGQAMRGLGSWRLQLAHDLSCIHFPGDGPDATRQVFAKLFRSPVPHERIEFTAGAIFVATRDAIRSRSLDFWKLCLSLLDNGINPIEGYIFERLWEAILDPRLEEH